MGKALETFFPQRPRLAAIGLVGLFGLLALAITIAPAFVSLAVGVLTAAGWCWWLETTDRVGANGGPLHLRQGARAILTPPSLS